MQHDILDVATRSAQPPAALIDDGDGRSKHFRRFKGLVQALGEEIGGVEGLTAAQATQLRNIAAMQLRAEQLQGCLVRGEPVDGTELTRLTMVSSRLLAALRRGRAASPAAA